MATIFLTGASGYLGACVARLLVRRGHTLETLRGRLADLAPGSIETPYVVHAAAALRHREAAIRASNTEGTLSLIRALRPGARVVFLSSRAVYGAGQGEGPVPETAPLRPDDAYAESKCQGESYLRETACQHLVLRPSVLFGCGVENTGRSFVNAMLDSGLEKQRVTAYGGQQLVDPLYVWTLAEVVALACEERLPWNEVYNVAGPALRLGEVAEGVCQAVRTATGRDCNLEFRPAGPPGIVLDTAKLHAALGGLPTPTLREILAPLARARSRPSA